MSSCRLDNSTGYTLHYDDLVLGCIAASLGLEAVIGYATPVAFELSVAALGIAAIGFIAHALFVNGPVDELEKLTDELEAEDVPSVLLPVHSAD